MPVALGEGHKGVQLRPVALGEIKFVKYPGFIWLFGVNPGEKLKMLLDLPNFLESFEDVDIFLS